MSSERVDRIVATFGAREVAFRLQRDVRSAEAHAVFLGPLLDLHQRIIAGAWTQAEIACVLALAYVGAPLCHVAIVPEVGEALAARPAATYVPLAARVIEAHLFGVASDLAQWDERDAFTGADA